MDVKKKMIFYSHWPRAREFTSCRPRVEIANHIIPVELGKLVAQPRPFNRQFTLINFNGMKTLGADFRSTPPSCFGGEDDAPSANMQQSA